MCGFSLLFSVRFYTETSLKDLIFVRTYSISFVTFPLFFRPKKRRKKKKIRRNFLKTATKRPTRGNEEPQRLATFDVGWQADRVRALPQLLADSGMSW